MTKFQNYIRDGAEIYRNSFAIIRAETDLSRFEGIEEKVAVRIIHACGMTDIASDIEMSSTFAASARAALLRGAPILCDAKMVAHGITRSRLPSANSVICTLDDPAVARLAAEAGNTRSATALELWRPHLEGAIVAIGNDHRRSRGFCGRRRIQAGPCGTDTCSIPCCPRPPRRKRHGGCGDQCAGE